MTDPLVDRDRLIAAISGVDEPTDMDPIRADRVIDYLRDVLTPEALEPREMEGEGFVRTTYLADGTDLHRRIFGEDR